MAGKKVTGNTRRYFIKDNRTNNLSSKRKRKGSYYYNKKGDN